MQLKEDFKKFNILKQNGFLFDADTKTAYSPKSHYSLPEGFEDWDVEIYDPKAYMNERLKELGINKKDQLVNLYGGVNLGNDEQNEQPVFICNKFGDIEILQYSLYRKPYTYKTKGKESTSASNREKYNCQTRLHPLHENMCNGKYDFTHAKNSPFWHKSLIEIFEEEAELDQLVITEGQIKAFKASHDGIPTLGLTSISHFRDRDTQTIHPEIIDFLKQCKVKRLVILWDGDCRNISSKALNDGEDLATRPNQFYKFAKTIRELIQDFIPAKKLEIYFSSIKSDQLEDQPKGIDDLLVQYKKDLKEIKNDFSKIGDTPSKFFDWINITTETGVKKMRKWFFLDSEKRFYQFHQDQIKDKDFVFYGTTYRIENNTPLKKIDANVKNYKRIGIDYYKITKEPVPTGRKNEVTYEEVLTPWNKTAIVDDHGKEVIKHVERFEGFTNIASHTDYRQQIGGYWNLYYNVDHNAQPGEWPHIKQLLQHLFAEQYIMVLDYLTVLYRKPMQKLPVICLVSKEQGTGKSTFIYLMKLIFKQNMAIISNSDLIGDFNSHWTSKLVVASEETILEKKDAYEKIKALSTAKTIQRNEKNKAAKEIPCMVHFVFCSNHEDDFIKIDDYDSRLWIRKVKSITQEIDHFDEKLENEVPYFVDFLEKREVEHPQKGRLYFHPEQFRTDAFRNVVKHSEPTVIKELREYLHDHFMQTDLRTINMTVKLIKSEFGIRFDMNYINKMIRQYFKLEPKNSSFTFYRKNALGEIEPVKRKGRFFTFERADFVEDEKSEQESKYLQTSIID